VRKTFTTRVTPGSTDATTCELTLLTAGGSSSESADSDESLPPVHATFAAAAPISVQVRCLGDPIEAIGKTGSAGVSTPLRPSGSPHQAIRHPLP
jgi:hypothetical protein